MIKEPSSLWTILMNFSEPLQYFILRCGVLDESLQIMGQNLELYLV